MKKQVKDSQNVPNTITSSVDGTEPIQNNQRIIFPGLEPSLFTGAAVAAANFPMSHYHAVSEKGSHPVFQCGILTGTCNLTNQRRPGMNGAVSNTELIEVLDEVERLLSLAPSLPKLEHQRHQ